MGGSAGGRLLALTRPSDRFGGAGRGLVAVILVVVVAAVCIRLGFWQLDRLQQRRASNEAIASAMARPALLLDSATVDDILENPEGFLFRIASVRGSFDHERDIVLRGRAHQGRPGVHLVSVLRLDGVDATILVNRGWLPAPDAASADPRPYAVDGIIEITGILQAVPTVEEPQGPVPVDLGDTVVTSYRRLDHATIARSIDDGSVLPRLYLQELPSATASTPPIPVPAPELDEGPHLGYAIQWFSFAAIAVGGLFAVAVGQRRRGH